MTIILVLSLWLLHVHDWYEQSCCGNTHCHTVPDGTVVNLATGLYIKGHGMLAYSDPRILGIAIANQRSQDEKDHVCELKDFSDGHLKLLCVYRRQHST